MWGLGLRNATTRKTQSGGAKKKFMNSPTISVLFTFSEQAAHLMSPRAISWVESSRSMGGANLNHLFRNLWWHDEGQDIAEYAVMLAVILVLVVGTIRLVGSNANTVFSSAASSIQ
jgi:Flp pilus assembly pilin Flp